MAAMVKEAKAHLSKREELRGVIVIGNPEWRPSLMGLVANSLVEEYERPAFIWGRDGEGTLKGSCRSFNGYDLVALMGEAKESFIEFGGHKAAGGFSATLEQISVLEEKLSEALAKTTSPSPLLVKERELLIALSDVGDNLWNTVSLFAPFGVGNEKPVFKLKGNIKSLKQFGKENNHLEVILTDGKKDIKAISFFSTPLTYKLTNLQTSATLQANLEKSYFRNRPEVRLRIVNIEA